MNGVAVICVADDLNLGLNYVLKNLFEPLAKGLKKSKLEHCLFIWPEHSFKKEDILSLFKNRDFDGLILVGGGASSLPQFIEGARELNKSALFVTAGMKNEKGEGYGYDSEFGAAQSFILFLEALGLVLPFSALLPSGGKEEKDVAYRSGRLMKELLSSEVKFNNIVTLKALENAAKILISCQAFSPEIKETMVKLGWDKRNYKIPVLVDSKPKGQHPANFFWWAGGVTLVSSELDDKLDLDEMNITGVSLGRIIKDYRESKSFDQESGYLKKRGLISQDIIHPALVPIEKNKEDE